MISKELDKKGLYNEKISYCIIDSTNDYKAQVEPESSELEIIADAICCFVNSSCHS